MKKETLARATTPQLSSAPVPASKPAPLWIRRCLLTANYSAPLVLLATRFRRPWLIAGAACIHAAFFYAVVAPSCAWFGPVATRFRPRGREVWLTIDDGPAGEASLQLSAEMVRRGVRATFFVKGENLDRQPKVARALLAAGHSLANHTQSHPAHRFWAMRPAALHREIIGCDDALRRLGVIVRRWFRSPVGLKNVALQPALAALGLRLIGWSVRGHDGLACDPAAVEQRVAEQVAPGAIILLHEGRARSNEAILRVIDALQTRGYSFVIPADEQLV